MEVVMSISGSIEYRVVTGTLAAISTFNQGIASLTSEGFALVNAALVEGTNITQLMFRNVGASMFTAQWVITVAPTVGVAGAGKFSIVGDVVAQFHAGYKFTVVNSTDNDGIYTVMSTPVFVGGTTVIAVIQPVDSAVIDGIIIAHPGYPGN